jgi:hypothetical protein
MVPFEKNLTGKSRNGNVQVRQIKEKTCREQERRSVPVKIGQEQTIGRDPGIFK